MMTGARPVTLSGVGSGAVDESTRGPGWRTRASCRGAGPGLFFDPDRTGEAALVCAECPVTAECRAAARGQVGFWAGAWRGFTYDPVRVEPPGTPSGIDLLPDDLTPGADTVPAGDVLGSLNGFECGVDPRCGTRSGHARGGRCDDCREADADYRRRRRNQFRCGTDHRCGTSYGYDLGGRCDACKAAGAAKRAAKVAAFRCRGDDRCGTAKGYRAGCRDKVCRNAYMARDW